MKPDLFVQTPVYLMKLRLPPRLLQLYGRIRLYAGEDGKCYAKQSTLAREIGIESPRQIRNLLGRLRRLKLIEWTDGPWHAPNTYRVLPPDRKWISAQAGKEFPASGRKPVSARKEESSSSEESKRGPSPAYPPPPSVGPSSPKVGAATAKPKPTAQPPRANPDEATAQQARPNPNETHRDNFDDDPNLTPEQRFEARLLKRHGEALHAAATIKIVNTALANYAGVSFADFLEFDQQFTTGNVRNPGGYYRRLAEKCGRHYEEQRAAAYYAASAKATATDAVQIPLNDKGRCLKCGGLGKLNDRDYCDCPMGKDLERVMRRKPRSETRSRVNYSAL